jgi:hypothetical protein
MPEEPKVCVAADSLVAESAPKGESAHAVAHAALTHAAAGHAVAYVVAMALEAASAAADNCDPVVPAIPSVSTIDSVLSSSSPLILPPGAIFGR